MAQLVFPRKFYTPSEVAKLTGVSRQYIAQLCRDGVVPDLERTKGGHWRIPVKYVEGVGEHVKVYGDAEA